jgi:hypothetical protein
MVELMRRTKRKQPNALVLTSNLRIVDGVKQESKKEAKCFNDRTTFPETAINSK